MNNINPIPENELNRTIELTELDVDFSDLKEQFKDLTRLAAKVAGTNISLINLIDSFTQWSIADHGLPLVQMPREHSVCQYTIMENDSFEVKDLSVDERFKDKDYVVNDPRVKYYFGIPLKTKNGHHIGALCVMDGSDKNMTPEKIEMLQIIAGEIVNRLSALRVINTLTYNLKQVQEVKKQVAHDIRGPIGGIIGLAQIISQKGDQNNLGEVLQFINLIQKCGTSLLELADEILDPELKAAQKNPILKDHEINLPLFKEKLLKLYLPQAKNKGIGFKVFYSLENELVAFSKNKLLQITGNLISNAIKFSPVYGLVSVYLALEVEIKSKTLHIKVSDNGIGLTEQNIKEVLNGTAASTNGTNGEPGYGFGLPLVKFLIDSLKGTLQVSSAPDQGTSFNITLPVN